MSAFGPSTTAYAYRKGRRWGIFWQRGGQTYTPSPEGGVYVRDGYWGPDPYGRCQWATLRELREDVEGGDVRVIRDNDYDR